MDFNMLAGRKTSGRPPGWMSAVTFNGLLALIPLIAVNVLASGFAGAAHDAPPTAESLAETGSAMDDMFDDLSDNGETARANWAALIAEQLEARNMSAVRGFMLAALQMLSPGDQRAIRAAAEAEPSGTEDERLLRAALIFLPSDIRVSYETSVRPRGIDLVTLDETEEDTPPTEAGETDTDEATIPAAAPPPGALQSANLVGLTDSPVFSVLGTVEDLVSQSRDWLRGNHERHVEMRLTGIAMASPPSATGLTEAELIQSASILKTAWKSKRLQPEYARSVDQSLTEILPDGALIANLEAVFSEVSTLDVRARHTQDAFAASVNTRAAQRFGSELRQISQIVEATDPRGTLTLLEHTSTPDDIRRARLIAQAGGDRAVALATQLGPDILTLTGSGIQWSETIVLNIMALAGALIALSMCALSALRYALFGRRLTAIL